MTPFRRAARLVRSSARRKKNRHLYNPWWDELIRFGRADERCEVPGCGAERLRPHPRTGSKVILTVAHLNHNRRDDRGGNLLCVCQEHHFAHDRPVNAVKAAATRRLQRSP